MGEWPFSGDWPLASWGSRATAERESPVGRGKKTLHPWRLFRWGVVCVGAGVDVASDAFSTCSGSGLRWTNRPGGQQIWLAGKGNRHDMCWVGRGVNWQ